MPRTYADWHWWRASDGGRPIVWEAFGSLPGTAQAGLLSVMQAWLDGSARYKEVAPIGDGLYELRHRELNNHYRVLFCIEGDVCVALHCFYKNQRKCPPSDLNLARKRMRSGCHGPY